jgi:hypothetical protein
MAVTWKKLAYEDDVILKSVLAAKGSIITASAASTPTELAIGTDGYLLAVSTDTPAWIDPTSLAVGTHATTHKNGGTDELLLHELGEPTSAVAFDGQQAQNIIIHTVADAAGRPTAAVGKFIWQTDTLAPYVCTIAV